MSARILRLALLVSGLAQIGCDLRSNPEAGPTPILPPASVEPGPVAAGGAGILLGPETTPPGPLLDGLAVRAQHSAPVVGGTLLVTRDGSTIVAADPERDAIFLVKEPSRAVTALSLSRGDEPGRIAEGPDGTLFVALRRAGALLQIDVPSATITHRVAVCASPRGVAYDAKTASVYVACRSGQLLTLDAATLSRKRTLQLDTDLRDVIVREHDLLVTRFANAELMLVADDGSIARRARPPSSCGDATVGYRALALPNGRVAFAHQLSSNDTVGVDSGAYGSSSSCNAGLVSRLIDTVDPDTASQLDPLATVAPGVDPTDLGSPSAMTFRPFVLPGAGPLDVAFDAQATRLAAIALDDRLAGASQLAPVPSGFFDQAATLWLSRWNLSSAGPDLTESSSVKVAGQPVAVTFSAAGKYIVQSREPATLEFEDGSSVRLSDESHADTGHLMFHMNSGIGIACASCHPEGGDDGHVWRFPEGLRRTMPLEGGVLERAP